jgi:gas vesicle protein
MGKFKAGLFFGGLLGAGLMWLNVTESGRKTRDELLDHAAKIYADLKEKIQSSPQYKDLTKNQYVQMVKEYVDKYAIENGLAEKIKNIIVKVVSSQYKNLIS